MSIYCKECNGTGVYKNLNGLFVEGVNCLKCNGSGIINGKSNPSKAVDVKPFFFETGSTPTMAFVYFCPLCQSIIEESSVNKIDRCKKCEQRLEW